MLGLLAAGCGGPAPSAQVVGEAPVGADADAGTGTGTGDGVAPEPAGALPTGLEDPLYPDLGAPGMDVLHYDVALAVDGDLVASGTVTLTIEATDDLSQIALDARSLTVSRVRLDGEPVPFVQEEPELLIRPPEPVPAASTFDLAVTYVDDPTPDPEADRLGSGWVRSDGYAFTVDEPEATRGWLPSLDHPSDKATWRFSITPPSGTIAVANGLPVSEPGEDGDGAWVWEVDQPMATYLVQVLVGDWVVVEAPSVDGIRRISALLEEAVDDHDALLDGIDEQMAFLSGVFGPYPFSSYGVAVVDEEIGLALEQQTRSLFGPDTADPSVAVHELAHQWYGDAVTPARWSDVWLAESFATYAQWLWEEEQGGDTVAALAAEALVTRRADGGPPTDDPTVDTLFGFNVYEGGGAVVHALRREIGDVAFFTLLPRWIAENDGTSRTTEDFEAFASVVAGRDLADFFTTWVSASELPATFPG